MTKDEASEVLDEVEAKLDAYENAGTPSAPQPGVPHITKDQARYWLKNTAPERLKSLRDVAKTDDELRARTLSAADRVLDIFFPGRKR